MSLLLFFFTSGMFLVKSLVPFLFHPSLVPVGGADDRHGGGDGEQAVGRLVEWLARLDVLRRADAVRARVQLAHQ